MKVNRWSWNRRNYRSREAGQSIVFMALVLGIALLGALCFAFDLSNMWFHRQAAQTAADAACAAGAMDILVDAEGGATGKQGFTLGTGYSCTSSSTDSVCKYAAQNGYTTTGNAVSVSFPSTVPGVTPPPTSLAGAYPFIRVDIIDHVPTFFAGLFNGGTTKDVRAFSTCGVELATAPIPLIVLDPRSTDGATLSVQGSPTISIYGGPQQSIQVDSNASAAVNIGGSAKIDLSSGGPNITGSNLGVYGGPSAAPGGFLPGTTGNWLSPSSPISDPFAQIPAPAQPSAIGGYTVLTPGTGECPNVAIAECHVYTPGYYANGIKVKGAGGSNLALSLFEPGIYYVLNGFTADANSCIRPSTQVGDGSGGTMFYFADGNSVNVTSNSGAKCTTNAGVPIVPLFNTTSGTGSVAFGAKCTSASTIPSNLPATISGSVLLGPCQAPTVTALCTPNCGINYGDPQGTADPLGEQRGFLFFQDRAVNASTNPTWQGGGSFLLSGTMYFHQCVSSGSDVGTGCSSASAFNDNVSLGGNSSSGTYILGQIVADQISLGGNSGLTMDLNPTQVYSVLKASILQ
jgi:hypothetical protein